MRPVPRPRRAAPPLCPARFGKEIFIVTKYAKTAVFACANLSVRQAMQPKRATIVPRVHAVRRAVADEIMSPRQGAE